MLLFPNTAKSKSPYISCYLRHDCSVCSASAYQSVDSGFESRLRLIFLTRRKIFRCLAGVLFQHRLLISRLRFSCPPILTSNSALSKISSVVFLLFVSFYFYVVGNFFITVLSQLHLMGRDDENPGFRDR